MIDLFDLPMDSKPTIDDPRENICDILSFCLQHHGYRIKYFILGNNVIQKVLQLCTRPEHYLVLGKIFYFFLNFFCSSGEIFQDISDDA
jgi:hypothetical protein